jgi:hypothetical protein
MNCKGLFRGCLRGRWLLLTFEMNIRYTLRLLKRKMCCEMQAAWPQMICHFPYPVKNVLLYAL